MDLIYENYIEENPLEKNVLTRMCYEDQSMIAFYSSKNHVYRKFSNFCETVIPVKLNGETIIVYNSEALFQAGKFLLNNLAYAKQILNAKEPGLAAKLGRDRKIKGYDPNWENKKFNWMLMTLRQKVKYDIKFKDDLVESADKILIENTYYSGDNIWGCGKDGNGKNLLGIALMTVRDEIKRRVLNYDFPDIMDQIKL